MCLYEAELQSEAMNKDINIIRKFFKILFLTVVLLSIISIVLVYISEKNRFHKLVVQDIAKEVLEGLQKTDSNLTSSAFIEEIKSNDFELFEIYDVEKKKLFHFAKDKNINSLIDELEKHNREIKLLFPINKESKYKTFTDSNEQFYIFIFTPLYKQSQHIGFLKAIKKVDEKLIRDFEEKFLHTISVIILSVTIFALALFPIIYYAYKELKQKRMSLIKSNIMTINTLGNTIALRDSDTDEHNYRVTLYAVRLAEALNMSKEEIQEVIIGAFLHDIGKIGIEDAILLKNGRLDEDEFSKMKEHVQKGVHIVQGNQWLEKGKNIIAYHHEKYDGSGYPYCLSKEKIPKAARLFAIVDVFDALTSKRPYKKPFSYEKSIEILKKSRGTHFDPTILDTFLAISKEVYDYLKNKSSQDLKEELSKILFKNFLDEDKFSKKFIP